MFLKALIFLSKHFPVCIDVYSLVFVKQCSHGYCHVESFQTKLARSSIFIQAESLIGDAHVDLDAHCLFNGPLTALRINNFQNDDHCESWTRFKKGELSSLISKLGLEEQISVFYVPGHFCAFH